MRPIRTTLLVAGISASLWSFSQAQQTTPAPPADDFQTMAQALEATTPIPASQLPTQAHGFFSVQNPSWPPQPVDALGLNAWPLDDGFFALDDRGVDYSELQAEAEAQAEALASGASGSPFSTMASSRLNSSDAYGNPVYLTNLAVSASGSQPMGVSFSVAGGTNNVPYDILMSTNVAQPLSEWSWLGVGYTSNRYTFSNQPLAQAFYILAKPSKTMVVPWGDDYYGQCDIPSGITNAVQVTGGIEFSLALLNNGTVVGWGYNGASGLVPASLAGVTMIASGWEHNVALRTNGTVTAWGDNFYGQLNVPSNLTNATVVSAQALHTLALTSNGTVVAWGYNGSGETNVPPGLSNVVAIAAGFQFNLAAKADGTVTAWGGNSFGQCNVPPGLSNVVDVAAGTYHSLALLKDGTVVAWGDDLDGETDVPAGLTNVVAIAASGDPETDSAYSLAIRSDGTVVAWGEGEPVNPVGGLNNVIAISPGADHALAIRTGPATPVITLEPTDQYQFAGGEVTFTTRGVGLYGVTYQWQFEGVNISGATGAALTLTSAQATQQGVYNVVVTGNGGTGGIASSNASFILVIPPAILSQTPLTSQLVNYTNNVTLSVGATAPGETNGFPLSYQWQFDGTNIAYATQSNYTFSAVTTGSVKYFTLRRSGHVLPGNSV